MNFQIWLKGYSLTVKLAAEAAANDFALCTESIVGKPKEIVRPTNIKEGDSIVTVKVAQDIRVPAAIHQNFLAKHEIQRRKSKEQEKEEPFLKENKLFLLWLMCNN